MQTLIGAKKSQGQRFLENGTRIPVTLIDIKNNWVVSQKTTEKDKYQAVQLGFSMKKRATKAELGHVKGANLEKAPKFLREVRLADDEALPEVGTSVNPLEVFAPGDIVNVQGLSKGKGFAGVVKRHGFAGGPKTHGQSDRHRAPGAIGQGTTPGRVYKGKRMAGRMGSDTVTIENLEVVDVNEDTLTLKGLVPGIINGLIVIKKVDENKKFVPLWKPAEAEAMAGQEAEEVPAEEVAVPETSDETQTVSEEVAESEAKVEEAQAPSDEAPAELATDAVTGEPAGEEPTTQDATPEVAENVENTNTAEQVEEAAADVDGVAASSEGEGNANS